MKNEEKLLAEKEANQYLTSIIVPLIVPSHSKATQLTVKEMIQAIHSSTGNEKFEFARDVA